MATSSSSTTYDASQSRTGSIRAAGISTYSLAVIAVSLRFLSRRIRKASWWLDDWLLLSSLASGLAFLIDVLLWIPKGLGGHYVFFGPQVLSNYNKHLFAGEITYTLSLVLVKYGILALYWRIFNFGSIRKPIIITAGIVTAWGIAVIVVSCLSCIPTRGFWDKSVAASCHVNSNRFFMGVTITNIITDGWLLLLPIPYVLKLQTSRWQKALLSGMFLLGGLVTLASIMRLVSVVTEPNDPDVTWTFAIVIIWSLVEVNVAITSANLPCLGPIYSYLVKRTVSVKDSLAFAKYSSRHNTNGIGPENKDRFQLSSWRFPGRREPPYDTLDEERSLAVQSISSRELSVGHD